MRQLAEQVISPEGVEPEETVAWEGELEKAVERDESGTKRKGGWRLFDAMRGKDDYSWQGCWAVMFSGGDCPRIELFGSKTAAEAEAAEPETFALRGAQLLQEPEDKHATVLLCLTQPGLDGEDQVLRLRVDDKPTLDEPVTSASTFRPALDAALADEDLAAPAPARLLAIEPPSPPSPPASASSGLSSSVASSHSDWEHFIENHAAALIQAAWFEFCWRKHGLSAVVDAAADSDL